MFWRTEAAFQTNSLATLLDKPDVSLKEIMDDEYILQEIKCGNKRLTDFLIKDENVAALTKLCVTEPDASENEQKKFKYCHLASEILSAGSESLTWALSRNSDCYSILAAFVRPNDRGPSKSLNPLLASFFNKVFSLLVSKHSDQVLLFMQTEPAFLDNLIGNLDVSAFADSLFRLACGGDDDKNAHAVKTWLAEHSFVSKLISQLDISKSEETHQNVTFLLCELIRTLRRDQYARDDNPLMEEYVDPLVQQLESRPILDDLVERILVGKDQSKYCDSVTANGCAILITLLQTVIKSQNPLRLVNESGKYDPDGQQQSEDEFIRLPAGNRPAGIMWEPDIHRVTENCLTERLGDFQRLLAVDAKTRQSLLLPMGKLDAPLGSARLALTQLLAQLLANGLPAVHEKAFSLDLMQNLIILFLKHEWNNFLHTNVVNCFICALYGRLTGERKDGGDGSQIAGLVEVDEFGEHSHPKVVQYSSPLLKQLLETHHMLKLVVQKHGECLEITKKPGAVTPPFTGHIMRLAVCTYYATRDGPNASVIKESFEKLPEEERQAWTAFVDTYLLAYIKRNEPDLVGSMPARDDDGIMTDHSEDFAGGPGMTPASEFATLAAMVIGDITQQHKHWTDNAKSEMPTARDFLKDEPMDEAAFEAMCTEKSKSSGGNVEAKKADDDDEWNEKEITFRAAGVGGRNVFGESTTATSTAKKRTSSSDEEDEKMEVDKDDGPPEWTSATPKKGVGGENWASFDDIDWTTPSSKSAFGSDTKKEEGAATQNNWANFDQAEKPVFGTGAGVAKPAQSNVSPDAWMSESVNNEQESSKKRDTLYQGGAAASKGQPSGQSSSNS